jgi:hypothetical protein
MERVDKKGKIFYQKLGGGSLRLHNRIIKPNQKFWEFPENIPKAFLDCIKELDATNVIEEKEGKGSISEKKEYHKVHKGGGWYDILDENDKKMNDGALKKVDAEEMLKQL